MRALLTVLLSETNPTISGLGFVLAARGCSRTTSTRRSRARQSLAETRTCRMEFYCRVLVTTTHRAASVGAA